MQTHSLEYKVQAPGQEPKSQSYNVIAETLQEAESILLAELMAIVAQLTGRGVKPTEGVKAKAPAKSPNAAAKKGRVIGGVQGPEEGVDDTQVPAPKVKKGKGK